MSTAATAGNESPFFVRAGGEDVFGIVTEPTGDAKGVAVIVLSGGAFVGATNRNRVSVRLTRRLAELGYHGVRMDYHGVGESTGEVFEYRLEHPFVDDLLAVVAELERRGVHEFVLLGSTCFGSRTALAAAECVPGLRAVVMIAVPLRDHLDVPAIEKTSVTVFARRALTTRVWRGLRDRKRRQRYVRILRTKILGAFGGLARRATRQPVPDPTVDFVSPRFFEPLAKLAERRTPVLIGYGDDEPFYVDFCAARGGRLGKLLDAPDSPIDVRTVPDGVHALLTLDAQRNVIELVVDWIASLDTRFAPAA